MKLFTDILKYWISLNAKKRYFFHVFVITLLIFSIIQLASFLQINMKAINPLSRSLVDYEITDMVFSKFRDRNNVQFDDKIIIVNTAKPDREKLAQAIEKLNQFNVKAIGIDLLFEDKKDPIVDERLQATFQNTSNLVLADVLGEYDVNTNEFGDMKRCHPYFKEEANTGYINFVAEAGNTIRLFSISEMTESEKVYSFAVKLALFADPEGVQTLFKRKNVIERINYKGNQESFVKYELDQIIDSKQDLSKIFDQKIVLFGYTGGDDWSKSSLDKFYTPMNDKIAAKSLPDMFGVLIHANILSMILEKSYITEFSKWMNRLLEFLVIMVSVAIIRFDFVSYKQMYWILIRLMQIIVFLFLFYLVAAFFYFFDIRLSMTAGIIGVLIAWDTVDLYENILLPRVKSLILKLNKNSIKRSDLKINS